MNTCIICNKSKKLTNEHIIPEVLGGSLVVKNVCSSCNSRMGSSFEKKAFNNILFKLHRYTHELTGKKKNTVPFPFAGDYKDSSDNSFQVDKHGGLKYYPKIVLKENEEGIGVQVLADLSDQERISEYITKKVTREYKESLKHLKKPDIKKRIRKLLETSTQTVNSVINPQIHCSSCIDLDSVELLLLKIGYELACYHFSSDIKSDPTGNTLRESLLNLQRSHHVLGGINFENDPFEQYISKEYYWVIFLYDSVYVKLLGFNAFFKYVSPTSSFQTNCGIVYRFCYKTKSYECSSIIESLFRRETF